MTTLGKDRKICAICHTANEYVFIQSTNTFGSMDLDSRPAEMARSTIFTWVQRCVSCGYCASDISEARPEAQTIISGREFKSLLANTNIHELVKYFLCAAMIDRELKNCASATWALIHASWACDDVDDREQARFCRIKAAEMLILADKHDQNVADPKETCDLILVDLFRRAGHFKQARSIIAKQRGAYKKNKLVNRILKFQSALIDRKNISAYNIEDALNRDTTPKKPEPPDWVMGPNYPFGKEMV